MKLLRFTVKLITFTFISWVSPILLASPEIGLAKLPLYFCQNYPSNNFQTNVSLGPMTMTDSSDAYQAGFNSSTWSGILREFSVNKNADGSANISTQFQWDAGKILNNMSPNQRKITTYNAATKTTTAFEFNSLPVEAQTIFNLSPSTGVKDDLGIQRINYLYGDRTLEQLGNTNQTLQFRVRDSILGDIVNSVPIYVGGAKKNIVGPNYQAFFEQFKNRPGTIYVSANDGMLHAFSANTGFELFAYIFSPLLTKLPNLTASSYQHDSYMDGNIHVSEAQVSSSWRTVLTAGMGSGAKGIFALDVTSPNEFMKGRGVLFEFTDKDDADIGYITSTPLIAKISIGKNSDGSANYQYFVIVPSGYNASNASGDNFLFLLSLNKDPNSPWRVNNNYYKLKTSGNNSLPNALSTPGLVLNAQGAAIYAYAGDLQGHVWRFDFSKENVPSSQTPITVFTAADAENQPQPITTQPAISFAPGGGYLVSFGTGKYIEHADTIPANFKSNTFYTIRDTLADEKNNHIINDRSELARRILVDDSTGFEVAGADFTYGNGQQSATKKGWYVDFLHADLTGERSISKPVIAYGNVVFNTLIPNTATCNNSGTSKSYMFDLLTGKTANPKTITGITSQIGVLGSPFIVLTRAELGERDSIGQRNNIQYYSILNFGSGEVGTPSVISESGKTSVKAGRLSWREIQNWQDLK